MLQFVFEIIVAVLAVYGAYTALHELAALIGKWLGVPPYDREEREETPAGKEDSNAGEGKAGSGRTDHTGRDD